METTTTTSDVTSRTTMALDKLKAAVRPRAKAALLSFVLDVAPAPASRPRVARWGTYYSKSYEQFRRRAYPAAGHYEGRKVGGPVLLFAEHVVQKPKTTKRQFPKGDVDNYVKGPMDAMTQAGVFWDDDDQVVIVVSAKRFTNPGEEPHVNLEWIAL